MPGYTSKDEILGMITEPTCPSNLTRMVSKSFGKMADSLIHVHNVPPDVVRLFALVAQAKFRVTQADGQFTDSTGDSYLDSGLRTGKEAVMAATTDVEITVRGERSDGVTYEDSVHIDPEEWETMVGMIRTRIVELEQRPGHRSGYRSMAEYDRLVALVTRIDI
jgi:hypothetical protein